MRIDRIKLKTELAKRDMRQSELTKLAGVSKGTISGVMNGRSCNEETAEKIAEALKMPLEELKEER